MRKLKRCNNNTKRLAYTSLVRPILEYGAASWDPYREGQISALDRVQKKAENFARHANSPNRENLASRRKLLRICALFKAYCGERAWKAIGDRSQRPHYLSRVDHERKIRLNMFRALLFPSSGAHDYNADYHIGRFVLSCRLEVR